MYAAHNARRQLDRPECGLGRGPILNGHRLKITSDSRLRFER